MSEDESAVLFVSLIVSLILWCRWYLALATVSQLGNSHASRIPLFLTPLFCAAFLFVVLLLWSAADVRTSAEYIALFMLSGAATVGMTLVLMPLFGLSCRDDAVDTPNRAARWVSCAVMISTTLVFACANIGEGETIWMTLLPAALGLATLGALWMALECTCHFSEAIAVERDFDAGLHLSGFLLANGLLLGRAVAGDFVSWDATCIDFVRLGFPSVLLAGVVVGIVRAAKSQSASKRPAWARGFTPVGIQLIVALVWTWITR